MTKRYEDTLEELSEVADRFERTYDMATLFWDLMNLADIISDQVEVLIARRHKVAIMILSELQDTIADKAGVGEIEDTLEDLVMSGIETKEKYQETLDSLTNLAADIPTVRILALTDLKKVLKKEAGPTIIRRLTHRVSLLSHKFV